MNPQYHILFPVYVSSSESPSESNLCGTQEGGRNDVTVHCESLMIGRYVKITQPNVKDMTFCEVVVNGYQYHHCEFYDGDYRYGLGCVQKCHCQDQCHQISGECSAGCTPGYMMSSSGMCNRKCFRGFWGSECSNSCDCPSGKCDNEDGSCEVDCIPGYTGPTCREPCDSRHWGVNCENECSCAEECDSTTGHCQNLCIVGRYGRLCQDTCEDFSWGPGNATECINQCNCETPCDIMTGDCTSRCIPGFEGHDCTEPCHNNTWGDGCNNECNCEDSGEACDHITGNCTISGCKQWYAGGDCMFKLPQLGVAVTPIVLFDTDTNITVVLKAENLMPINIGFYGLRHKCNDEEWVNSTERIEHRVNIDVVAKLFVPPQSVCSVQFIPFDRSYNIAGEVSAETTIHTPCADGTYGPGCQHQCNCLNIDESCNKSTGACLSGCDTNYMGEFCDISKPSLEHAVIDIKEQGDLMMFTISNISAQFISSYMLEYTLASNTGVNNRWITRHMNETNLRKRRSANVNVITTYVKWEEDHINSLYYMKLTPEINVPLFTGLGIPSKELSHGTGCGSLIGEGERCTHWCQCTRKSRSRDTSSGGTAPEEPAHEENSLCLRRCDYCNVCENTEELPSNENVLPQVDEIKVNSMRLILINLQYEAVASSSFRVIWGDINMNTTQELIMPSTQPYHTFENLLNGTTYTFTIYPRVSIDKFDAFEAYPIYANATTHTLSQNGTEVIVISSKENEDNNFVLLAAIICGGVVMAIFMAAITIVIYRNYKKEKVHPDSDPIHLGSVLKVGERGIAYKL